jgi:hypothetical protein
MRWIAVVVLAGCFPSRSENYVCQQSTDCTDGRTCDRGFCVLSGADGAVPDGGTDCHSFSSQYFSACSIPPPGDALVLDQPGTYTYNTDFATLMDPASTPIHPPEQSITAAVLISVNGLTIAHGTTLRVVGAKPLLVASWSKITVDGAIDVASNPTGPGAGTNPMTCGGHAPAAGNNSTGGSGGGGGGGLSGTGGKGGNGNGQGTGGGVGGATAPTALAGGCPGAPGGTGLQAGGVAGDGGGAIQLSAQESIAVTGTINAGGAGGGGAAEVGGQGNGGGGGGGSGGCIGLESPAVSIASGAVLAANGGGGGGGAVNQTAAGSGGRGGDGAVSATPAVGGTSSNTGKGGAGGAGATLTGSGGGNDGTFAGGGGGGAAGFVVISSADATVDAAAVVSPPATH